MGSVTGVCIKRGVIKGRFGEVEKGLKGIVWIDFHRISNWMVFIRKIIRKMSKELAVGLDVRHENYKRKKDDFQLLGWKNWVSEWYLSLFRLL